MRIKRFFGEDMTDDANKFLDHLMENEVISSEFFQGNDSYKPNIVIVYRTIKEGVVVKNDSQEECKICGHFKEYCECRKDEGNEDI